MLVSAAVICCRGQVLLAQRREIDAHPLKWEFPGGKVDPGESPQQALVRELCEELHIKADVGNELARYQYEYAGNKRVELIFFAVRFAFPAGYEVPTHSHPSDEFITVISGKMRMAFGEKAAATDTQPLVPGSFMSLPAGAWHHLWVDADSVVELHSTGPFDVMLMTK